MKRRGTGNARMQDVADMARVGLSTVSRAFSEPERVSKPALRRIESAIAKLGYVRDVTARSLRARQTGRVLVIIPSVGNAFFTPILQGMEEVAAAAQRVILFGDSRRDALQTRAYTTRSYMTQLAVGRADALILLDGSLPITDAEHGIKTSEPVLAISEPSGAGFVTYVGIDNHQAAVDATMFLHQQGHRRIALLTGPAEGTSSRLRENGFLEVVTSLGLNDSIVVERTDFSIESARNATRRLLARGSKRPTAIFALSDGLAFSAIHELRANGFTVPTDMSVVGFDDIDLAAIYYPPLTTIRQPRYEMGRLGMKIVVDQLDNREKASREDRILDHELVVRDSVTSPSRPTVSHKRTRSP